MKMILSGIFVCFTFFMSVLDMASGQVIDSTCNCFIKETSAERGMAIIVDKDECAYITGVTNSLDFPTTSGVWDTNLNGHSDAFIIKLNSTGSTLEYATYLGGGGDDSGYDIALDNYGNVYVTGFTRSLDFPVVDNAFDETYNGRTDIFVAKLDANCSQIDFSTFLGGTHSDYGRSIDVDDSSYVYISGWTLSQDFPTTCNAFDTSYNDTSPARWDVFVVKLNPKDSNLIYSTYLGGKEFDWGYGIVADDSGCAYVTGHSGSDDFPITSEAFDTSYNGGWVYGDVFITKIDPTGNNLIYSTWLGGGGCDYGRSVAIDDSYNVYVTGYTDSPNFPTTIGTFDTTHEGIYPEYAFDTFISKLNYNASSLVFSTFAGGDKCDASYGISVDHQGRACITGLTYSSNFPTTDSAFDTIFNGGKDVFILRLNSTGTNVDYASYLGGDDLESGIGVSVDNLNNIYLTGYTQSYNFPTTAGALDTIYHGSEDIFVAKFHHIDNYVSYSTFISGDSTYPSVPVAIDNYISELPKIYALYQNYPNPFNASTEIQYQIPENGHVSLRVFNTLGQEVRALVDTYLEAGVYRSSWDGRDGVGQEVASGVYFCRLQAEDFAKTIKMVLLR